MSKRRAILILVALLILYPLSYLVASRDGEYAIQANSPPPFEPGGLQYGIELEEVWEPFPCGGTPKNWFHDARSAFFLPVALLDRKLWHKPKALEVEIDLRSSDENRIQDNCSDPEPPFQSPNGANSYQPGVSTRSGRSPGSNHPPTAALPRSGRSPDSSAT